MDILMIGGKRFLGRWLVEAAMARGHRLTLFNRGKSNPELFPQVEQITGERDSDEGLSLLAGRRWDAVIDTCGYAPRIVRRSAQSLAQSVERYVFISSISVYADVSVPVNEASPVGKLADETVEEISGETYGPLKALCEQAAEAAFPGRALNIRPGLIVGPHDTSDRFTYWPVRVSRGGETLAPEPPERMLQFIDVRDLAEWTVRLIEAKASGFYNADGLPGQVSFAALLAACQAAAKSDARFTWVSEAFLREQKVGEWIELPLWIDQADPANAAFYAADVSKAVAAGLSFRPLAETVQDTLTWAQTRPADTAWRAGMAAEREQELLSLWKNKI